MKHDFHVLLIEFATHILLLAPSKPKHAVEASLPILTATPCLNTHIFLLEYRDVSRIFFFGGGAQKTLKNT